jgi:hypothetical protein
LILSYKWAPGVSVCMQPSLISCAQSPLSAHPVTALFYKPPDILEDVLRVLCADSAVRTFVLLSGAPGIGKTAMAREVYIRCMMVRPLLTYIDMEPAVVHEMRKSTVEICDADLPIGCAFPGVIQGFLPPTFNTSQSLVHISSAQKMAACFWVSSVCRRHQHGILNTLSLMLHPVIAIALLKGHHRFEGTCARTHHDTHTRRARLNHDVSVAAADQGSYTAHA